MQNNNTIPKNYLATIKTFIGADTAAIEIWNKIKNFTDRESPECIELIRQYHEVRKLRKELFNMELEKDSLLSVVTVN